MRAALQVDYGDPESSIRVTDAPLPQIGRGEVLLRVQGAALNRKDLFALANLTGPGIRPRPPLPHVNGADGWGEVARVGPDEPRWRVGDRAVVYPGLFCGACGWCVAGRTSACDDYGVVGEQCWGTHAEYVRVPARNLEPIPAGMTREALACAGGSWLTAWHALVTVARLRPGETILVTGASGGVGTAAIRIAALTGCRVIASVGSPWKAQRAREIGADVAVVGMDADVVRQLTQGRGVDVALDTVGGHWWRDVIGALAPFGRMAICGATAGDGPNISIREIYQRHRQILGAPLGSRAEFSELVRVLASGRLAPVVHATIPLERIAEGLRMMERREVFGKVALQVAP
ncbi:MAG TPA: zinc-binding dehydrogenase [Vicinamibacterales bacterium]|nr:zinc-binding dehydrogenase [Vicinamibacterales bacterium]